MRNAKILLASALVLGASACGLSESKYADKAQEVSCEKLAECELVESVDACLALEGEEADTSSCEYDSGKAKECLDAIEAQSCDDLGSPAVCAEVYTNCETSSNNTSNTTNNTSNNATTGGSNNTSGSTNSGTNSTTM